MKSLEIKSEPMLESPMVSEYPCLYVSGKQMPEIDKWEVGEEYELKVKIKMQRYNSHTDIKSTHSDATLDVIAYDA